MLIKLATLVCLAALLGIVPAYGQRQLECDVPFDFNVGPTAMAAGKYLVTFPLPGTIRLRNERTFQSAVILTIPKQSRKTTSKLVFNRYPGERYFLSEVWTQGYDQGQALRMTRGEIEVARNRVGRIDVASR